MFGMELDLIYGAGTAKRMFELSKIPKQFKSEELELIIKDSKEAVAYYENEAH